MSINIEDLQNYLKRIQLSESDLEQLSRLNAIDGKNATVSISFNKHRRSSSSSSSLRKAELNNKFSLKKSIESYSYDYINFSYENPTTYHVVEYFSKKLIDNGFTYLSEKDEWKNLKLGKYFTTRSGLNLVAFVVAKDWTPSNGVGAVGSHIDSLALKLKPNSTKFKNEGYELLGVAPYSGALSDKWWDRDLAIGGRIILKQEQDNKFVSKLINSTPHPIAKIPSLAEHFGSVLDGPFNKETQMIPIIGYDDTELEPEANEDEKKSNLYGKHPIKLLRYIAKLANVKVSELYQFDLDLFDNQKGTIGGLDDEFLFVPRIDDKLCSFAAIDALIESSTSDDSTFNIVALYDNEEIGSLTRQGAQGKLLELVVEKFSKQWFLKLSLRQIFANSLLLSADVTHAYNPNFESQYLAQHRPYLNTGIVCKYYNETKTATDRVGFALVKQIGELNNDCVQLFSARNDVRTGGTIGSMIASSSGARTIDVGIPELSMHSIRGMTGVRDIGYGVKFFRGFFQYWNDVYTSFDRDV